jgi:phosphoglycerate kinase
MILNKVVPMEKLHVKNLNLKDKKVLVRVDFNTPVDEMGAITDSTRIQESLPTIFYIIEQGGIPILISHFGRPSGKKDARFSLAACAKKLEELTSKNILFASDCIGLDASSTIAKAKNGDIVLLENVRFYEAEENPSKDPSFAQKLSSLADLFVNDAFGAAHRKHSSTFSIATYFPGKSAMGFLMEKEVQALSAITHSPAQPFYAIIGGAKISSKIGALKSLTKHAKKIFIGGGMTYTFMKAQNLSIGDSIFEAEKISIAQSFLALCREKSISVIFPNDLVIANEYRPDAQSKIISFNDGIPPGWQGVDIGPKTIQDWSLQLQDAHSIFWNGPLGVFEFSQFSKGTFAIAKTIASLKNSYTVIGGGDSVSAIKKLGNQSCFTHVSTGGGASLEFLEFGTLPGVEALSDKK